MTPKLRAMVGSLTAVLFLGMGAAFATGGRPALGAALLALGTFRAVVLIRNRLNRE